MASTLIGEAQRSQVATIMKFHPTFHDMDLHISSQVNTGCSILPSEAAAAPIPIVCS